MKSYEQGRMDAWERIDAIKRRLGLAGFFNEQKHKRYPKGHPKAGEFMPKPKEGRKPVKIKKVFNLNLTPVRTIIDGHPFKLDFENFGRGVSIGFLSDGNLSRSTNLPPQTRRKAAFWWRRQAVETAKLMPDGVPLKALAYNGDGGGEDRLAFYKALGFHAEGFMVSGITKGGKIVPKSIEELNAMKQPEIREMRFGEGKPKNPYGNRFEDDDDEEDNRSLDQIYDESPDDLLPEIYERITRERQQRAAAIRGNQTASRSSLPLEDRSARGRSIMDIARDEDGDDDVFDFADEDDDDREMLRILRRGRP